MPVSTLKELEAQLVESSQSDEQIAAIREFSENLRKTAVRLAIFNAPGALVRAPIRSEETLALGFDEPDDNFALLQGDVICSESAFHLGERITGTPKYVVLNASCDVVPGRRQCSALLRVKEIHKSENQAGSKLNLLLKFIRSDSLYLPALGTDSEDVACNVIDFDSICQITSSNL